MWKLVEGTTCWLVAWASHLFLSQRGFNWTQRTPLDLPLVCKYCVHAHKLQTTVSLWISDFVCSAACSRRARLSQKELKWIAIDLWWTSWKRLSLVRYRNFWNRSISSHFVQRKFAKLRLTHTRHFVFAVGSLTGVLRRESLLLGLYS